MRIETAAFNVEMVQEFGASVKSAWEDYFDAEIRR